MRGCERSELATDLEIVAFQEVFDFPFHVAYVGNDSDPQDSGLMSALARVLHELPVVPAVTGSAGGAMRAASVGGVAAAVLGCAGVLGPDPAALAEVEAALGAADPTVAVPLLLEGAAASGLVRFGCAEVLSELASGSPDQRAVLIVAALSDPMKLCPGHCAGDLGAYGGMEPDARAAAIFSACDAVGPDPLFTGALAGLRPAAEPLEYLIVRAVAEGADRASPTFHDRFPTLAIGLAATGTGPAEATTAPGLPEALAACSPVPRRLVLDPAGKVVASVGDADPCVDAAIAAAVFAPADTYRVITPQ